MQIGSLTDLKGVGDKSQQLFEAAGIKNIYDLLNYFPRDYHDYSKITPIKTLEPGLVTLRAKLVKVDGRYVKRGMHITEAIALDETGSVKLVWFNQPYRKNSIKDDHDYYITGKLEFKSGRYAISSPTIELSEGDQVHTARIVPIYKESKNLNNRLIRNTMFQAVDYARSLPNLLPDTITKQFNLLSYAEAVKKLHFPANSVDVDQARQTMSFLEIFELMLASNLIKSEISHEIAPRIDFDEGLSKKFVSGLGFELTDSQRKVMWQILKDIDTQKPMNRLVEGDVGSGKTVVAAMAIAMTLNKGMQVAYLAPTEILARQHFETIPKLLKPLGLDQQSELLVGSLKAKSKNQLHSDIKSGKIKLIIGTHALLHGLEINELGLIIIDEQHRFGVDQRNQLMKHSALIPHILSMTATPIPRSLALTLYGELDISIIDAMPPGRKTTITKLVSPNSREPMEEIIKNEIREGRQVYVVCPLIDENSKIQSTSAELTFKRLSQGTFKDQRIALLHGKLKASDKNQLMEDFINGKINILVSTTVIEVGVNVPNASVMVIEGAERFGLAQMHQLRGRVGRSDDQAYCFVVTSDSKAPSKRLRAFTQVNNGFRLAELDLEIRGPGAIYGTLQHGALDLRFANLSDHKLIANVRQSVTDFVNNFNLDDYPELRRRVRLAQAVITLN